MHVLIYNLHDIKIFASEGNPLKQKEEKRKKNYLVFLLENSNQHSFLTRSYRFFVLLPVLFSIYRLACLSLSLLSQGS